MISCELIVVEIMNEDAVKSKMRILFQNVESTNPTALEAAILSIVQSTSKEILTRTVEEGDYGFRLAN